MMEEGQHEKAHEALDNLLSLGPGNLEALKLKSILFATEGRFLEEARVWERIIDQDNEDLDAIYFFQRRHLEERESFYFTDHLPAGGRRFLAHPRSLINASLGGLLGCTLFLLISSYAQKYYFLSSTFVSAGSFFLFVIVPWFFIIYTYFKALREVLLTADGICLNTRLKSYDMKWDEISEVYLARSGRHNEAKLALVLIPKDKQLPAIEIDLSRESTSIRARTCFIDEIARLFHAPIHTSKDELANMPEERLSF